MVLALFLRMLEVEEKVVYPEKYVYAALEAISVYMEIDLKLTLSK